MRTRGGAAIPAPPHDTTVVGIAAEMRARVLERGVRADQSMPGSGLGLAIVRDLAELYGGDVALGDSCMGGLRVGLRVPGTS